MSNSLSRRAALIALATASASATSALFMPESLRAYHDTLPRGRRSPRPAPAAPSGPPQSEASFGAIEFTEDDFVLGRADAPITIIKYASLTCPHCAAFHANTAPGLKEQYVEAGRVRYVHRDFPLDQAALAASVLLRCGDSTSERAFLLLDMLYGSQSHWSQANDPMAALAGIAAQTGVVASRFAACLADETLIQPIVHQRQEAAEVYGVRATPTLLINGERYTGNLSLAQVEAVIAGLA